MRGALLSGDKGVPSRPLRPAELEMYSMCTPLVFPPLGPLGKDRHAPPLWEVPRREVRVMREDTLLRVSRRTEDTLKIHLCEDTRPGPNEEVYLHTKIHRGPNEEVYLDGPRS